MKPRVCIETSMISYLAASPSRDPVTAGRQLISEQWWSARKSEYNLLISEAVETECLRGDPEMVARRRLFLQDTARFLELARFLVTPGAVPENAEPDAVHIAAAAVEKCEYLLTWNFWHIANARIREK